MTGLRLKERERRAGQGIRTKKTGGKQCNIPKAAINVQYAKGAVQRISHAGTLSAWGSHGRLSRQRQQQREHLSDSLRIVTAAGNVRIADVTVTVGYDRVGGEKRR